MAQTYFVDNLISRFIKCLLTDTYLPTVDIWKPGKSLIKGFTYITNDKKIVVANKDYKKGDPVQPQSSLDSEFFKFISNYVEGNFYRGITSNFESNSALYDSDTHKALGRYLRYIRDMQGVDLLPYYNCYSGISSDKIRIKENNLIIDNTVSDGLISYIVPVTFNQFYTIYYQTDIPFYIMPVYYDGVNVQRVLMASGSPYPATRVNICGSNKPYRYAPITFDGSDLVHELSPANAYSKYLHLLIQVPKNKFSNLLVLEGDYTSVTKNLNNTSLGISINRLPQVFIGDGILNDKLSQETLNNIFKPYSSLIENISDNNIAFSDRLIEYLLYSPIVRKDKIRLDIKRIQDYCSSEKLSIVLNMPRFSQTYINDVWESNLRYYIYNIVTQNEKTPLYKDLNGYVDKDSEYIIQNGKEGKGTI